MKVVVRFLRQMLHQKDEDDRYGVILFTITLERFETHFVEAFKSAKIEKVLEYVKIITPGKTVCDDFDISIQTSVQTDMSITNRFQNEKLNTYAGRYYCSMLHYFVHVKNQSFNSNAFAKSYLEEIPKSTTQNGLQVHWMPNWLFYTYKVSTNKYEQAFSFEWTCVKDEDFQSKINETSEILWENGDNTLTDAPYVCNNRTTYFPCPQPESTGLTNVEIAVIVAGSLLALLISCAVAYLVIYCFVWNNRHYLRRRWLIPVEKVRTKVHAPTVNDSKLVPAKEIVPAKRAFVKQLPVTVGQFNKLNVLIVNVENSLEQVILTSLPVLQEIAHIGRLTSSEDKLANFMGFICQKSCEFRLVFVLGSGRSLKRILKNVKLALDLKYSLIRDLASAMEVVHRSYLKFHGDLRTDRCTVDDRFVLRVMITRVPKVDELNRNETVRRTKIASLPNIRKSDFLWLPPELLRNPNEKPSQAGDVYSFALIVHQITYQRGLFYVKEIHGVKHGAAKKLTAINFQSIFRQSAFESNEITEAASEDESCAETVLAKVTTSILRPTMPFVPQKPKWKTLEVLITECWNPVPKLRPTFTTVLLKLNESMKKQRIDIGVNTGKRLQTVSKNMIRELLNKKAEKVMERDKCIKCLTHLMPVALSYEYLAGGKNDASFYENVTIYFNDIVEFTSLFDKRDLIAIIDILDDLFKAYDRIVELYDCTPLHRVGSSLLLASGVPRKNSLHASEIAQPALQIRQFVKTYDKVKFQMKAGIHSGEVMAGIVGKNIPQFGLFGDAVNTASRMASTGKVNEIQISESTRNFLVTSGAYNLSKPKEKEIKGKGKMKTCWLNGYTQWPIIPMNRRLDDLPAPKSATDTPPRDQQNLLSVTTLKMPLSSGSKSANLSIAAESVEVNFGTAIKKTLAINQSKMISASQLNSPNVATSSIKAPKSVFSSRIKACVEN